MKKIFGLLSIIMLCFVLVGCKKDEKYIFLGKQYESLKHIHEDDILEHVKLVSTLYPETSIDNFTDEEISIITIFKLMMNGETTTDEEIQKYVKNLFGKDKFNFEEGTYINPVPYQEDYDKIVVLKENGKYSSNLYGYGLNDPTNHFNSIEIKDDTIIVHYDYGYKYVDKEDTFIGKYDIYLKYEDKSLIIDKITYEKKAN